MTSQRSISDDLIAGLECFAALPRSSFLRREAVQAYNRLSGKEPDVLGTLFASFLEVFSVYFFILFDLVNIDYVCGEPAHRDDPFCCRPLTSS